MFKRNSFLIGIGLALLLIMVASITTLAADDPGNNPTPTYPSGKEIIEARSAHTKLFKNDDNTNTLLISIAPMHFQDQNGQWQEIDTTLENSTGKRMKMEIVSDIKL